LQKNHSKKDQKKTYTQNPKETKGQVTQKKQLKEKGKTKKLSKIIFIIN
jgi:hypothetical protein